MEQVHFEIIWKKQNKARQNKQEKKKKTGSYWGSQSVWLFHFTCFTFIFTISLQSTNKHIMRTKSPIDMKQTALEREFISFHYKLQN